MVAEGAERMAQEAGLATVEPSYFSTPRATHSCWRRKRQAVWCWITMALPRW